MTKRNLKDIFHHLTVEQQNGILRILDDVSDHHLNAGVEAQFESVDPEEYDEEFDHSVIYNKVNEVIQGLKEEKKGRISTEEYNLMAYDLESHIEEQPIRDIVYKLLEPEADYIVERGEGDKMILI
jgi:hypothetical protein